MVSSVLKPSCMKSGLYVGKNGALSLTSTTCILTIAVLYLCLVPGLYARTWKKDTYDTRYLLQMKLECGPMPNVMVALPNLGGALCSTPQSLADAHY